MTNGARRSRGDLLGLLGMTELRIGVLGAARITPRALIGPARAVDGVTVAAIAARDRDRAVAAAARHGIATVLDDYAAVIADPTLDAVYIPLPNGLHAQWTLAAIAAGKHVLCEKPFTSNAEQARTVADAAAGSGLVVMEAFHYRYHPLVTRVLTLLRDGAVGSVRRVETELAFPLPRFGDIRYNLALAGGALMDAGCYAVHSLRTLGGAEPQVVSARATMRSPGVDRAMVADLRFPNGAAGRIRCSMWSWHVLGVSARVVGDAGELRIFNYIGPHVYHRLSVRTSSRRWHERVPGESTYTHQLRAFRAAVQDGSPMPTGPEDSVATMTVIDNIYRAAGLEPRR
jgi:predicted dehydrogenase